MIWFQGRSSLNPRTKRATKRLQIAIAFHNLHPEPYLNIYIYNSSVSDVNVPLERKSKHRYTKSKELKGALATI